MNAVDLRLYALVDPQRAGRHALSDLAARVVAGGATLVQLRDKSGETKRMIEDARAIRAALAGSRVPFLVNDRVDVALAAGADGVHIGWDDMRAEDARRLLGPKAIIGLSINSAERARTAPLAMLDYVCIGGVFATMSKDNPNSPIGVNGARALAEIVRARAPGMPVGAIAGIDTSNAASVMAAGFDGVAIISALSMTPDPAAAARELRSIVDAAQREEASG
ncbi:MAG TPA: thiamine phosphate synthase [Xanthobacteraceae bacterium]|nr:thiamine phosphate synthase [Xanthobacteraceae bacterium]